MAVVYQLSTLTWMLSKLLVKVKYIALPNIIFNKPVVKEFIQTNAKADGITEYIQSMVDDEQARNAMSNELSNIKEVLGKPGASNRAADKILNHEK